MAENLPFDLDAFIEGCNRDCTKEKGTNDKITRVIMNKRDTQGSVTFIPFISKKVGNIYMKLEKVREINTYTSIVEAPDGIWYKILPLQAYGELTEAQRELYGEVVSLFDSIRDQNQLGYDLIRVRNYSMFTGVCIDNAPINANKNDDLIDRPCLFVFPSNTPIDALNTAIANKRSIMKDRVMNYLQGIISPALKGRKGAIVISFKKADGPGYTSSVTFETNNIDEGLIVVDPEREFSEELASKFDDPLQAFLGWMYDFNNNSYFNETAFRELRDNLKLTLKECMKLNAEAKEDASKPEPVENKNGSVDPMKADIPPVPGADGGSTRPAGRPF